MQDPIPVLPRPQPGAADIKSLVALGVEELPPIPTPVFQEPAYPNLPGGWTPDEPA
ncbi:hypothetical protein ACFWIO_18995 [Streptomyces diastatochromogenes]|uniref:hypothetical protein n=1 Tax=Streptomyces diastatochromogenes TaxID=42236 RepID=UPI0036685C82